MTSNYCMLGTSVEIKRLENALQRNMDARRAIRSKMERRLDIIAKHYHGGVTVSEMDEFNTINKQLIEFARLDGTTDPFDGVAIKLKMVES